MSKTRIIDFFQELDDKKRPSGNKQHELLDSIAISVCGVICGAESWEEIEEYGKIETATRHYISSLDKSAAELQKIIRSHWTIENKLH